MRPFLFKYSLTLTKLYCEMAKPLPKNAKSSLPVDVRCSETSFLKLPNIRNLAESLKFQGDK